MLCSTTMCHIAKHQHHSARHCLFCRCASLDGDADRLVYFTQQDGSFQLFDGDRIAVLAALLVQDILDQLPFPPETVKVIPAWPFLCKTSHSMLKKSQLCALLCMLMLTCSEHSISNILALLQHTPLPCPALPCLLPTTLVLPLHKGGTRVWRKERGAESNIR